MFGLKFIRVWMLFILSVNIILQTIGHNWYAVSGWAVALLVEIELILALRESERLREGILKALSYEWVAKR